VWWQIAHKTAIMKFLQVLTMQQVATGNQQYQITPKIE
jgi:hypothetical protein